MPNLRLALRLLHRQPLVSTLAIVALALGIGLTTTMFSIVNGVVLRGLPFEQSDRLMHVAPFDIKGNDDFEAAQWEFAEWRAEQRSFEDLAGFYMGNANVVAPDGLPERHRGVWITPNLFRVLRTQPALGRDFEDADGRPGAAPVAIISDRVWRDRFQARPEIVGQVLRVNGVATTVVGVMGPKFAFPLSHDLWVALAVNPAREARAATQDLEVIGRLRDGVSRTQATAEFTGLERQLNQHDAARRDALTVEIKPYVEEFLGSGAVGLLSLMLAAVMLVLVIACVNVANLVLARAADRSREVAVRSALGATRAQVVVQMLTEVLALAVAGAAIGLAIAWTGIGMFNRAIVDTNPPFWLDIRVDATVLLFVTVVTVVATLVAGLVPALRASRSDVAPILNDEGRGTTSITIGRLARGLVVGEVALSFALLVTSALAIRSILNVTAFDPGIATRDVFLGRVSLPAADYGDDEGRRRFAEALLDRTAALPGVQRAALSTNLPPGAEERPVALPGETYADERAYPRAQVAAVSEGYFDVLRMRPRQGRVFLPSDVASSLPVAVVSESFVAAHHPQGALGRQVRVVERDRETWRTIVGVVQDVMEMDAGPFTVAAVYVPLAQSPSAVVSVLLHSSGDPLAQTSAVRRVVAEIDRNLPIYNVGTLQKNLDANQWSWRVFGGLFTAFGAAALFLAVVGLYGVMAFTVSRRTPEFGVRMALGAAPATLVRLVLTQGAWQVGAGMLLGLALAVPLSRGMTLLLFQVEPGDPRVFAIVAAVLVITGFFAAIVPARRAARVDPMTALRQ
jgi:putative ABC transport system permease protein